MVRLRFSWIERLKAINSPQTCGKPIAGSPTVANWVSNRNDYQPKKAKKHVAPKLPFATLCAPFRLQGRPDSMFAGR